jgi:hypothetical protein
MIKNFSGLVIKCIILMAQGISHACTYVYMAYVIAINYGNKTMNLGYNNSRYFNKLNKSNFYKKTQQINSHDAN